MHKRVYNFSIGVRVGHWLRAISIFALIATGFYIADPFLSPIGGNEPTNFMYAKWRMVHLIFGFLLISVTIFKIYLFFTDKNSKLERDSISDFLSPKVWIAQIKYYLFLGPHPHTKGIYNPLQFIAYVSLIAMILAISITGLILYVHVYHSGLGGFLYDILRPIEQSLGGLAVVRELHHIFTWAIILFIPVHIYMAVYDSVRGKTGAIDSIISGYKWKKH
jgi:Ni/Fe-hydrogenase 1 B-type cytochrome subunit